MAKNVVISGSLALPQEDGGATAPFKLDLNFVYTKKAEYDQVYDGAVTDDPISLATMATSGAKMLLIKSSVGGCTFKVNGGSTAWPVPVGGYLLYANPSAGFITGLTVSVSGAASVSILALA